MPKLSPEMYEFNNKTFLIAIIIFINILYLFKLFYVNKREKYDCMLGNFNNFCYYLEIQKKYRKICEIF